MKSACNFVLGVLQCNRQPWQDGKVNSRRSPKKPLFSDNEKSKKLFVLSTCHGESRDSLGFFAFHRQGANDTAKLATSSQYPYIERHVETYTNATRLQPKLTSIGKQQVCAVKGDVVSQTRDRKSAL